MHPMLSKLDTVRLRVYATNTEKSHKSLERTLKSILLIMIKLNNELVTLRALCRKLLSKSYSNSNTKDNS